MLYCPLIFYAVFLIAPSTLGYVLALTDWSATRSSFRDISFVGLENLIGVINKRTLPTAFVNTLIYATVKTVLVTILGLFLAYMLNRSIKGRNILRTLYFLPSVFSALVVGLIFSGIFKVRGGPVNEFFELLGFSRIQWLADRWSAIFTVNVASIWCNVGYAMVISLAGMQSVSQDYLEAAKIDGANEWNIYTRVTLPLIMPVVNVNILTNIIYGLKMFDIIYVMTGGGPGYSTESLGTLMMHEMGAGRYASSVAVNFIFTVFLVIVSVAFKKFSERLELET